MISITNTSGHTLELSAGTVIPVERKNSLFNDPDEFIQDRTYPGKTFLSPAVKTFIQNGHLVETSTTRFEVEVKVSINGSAFFAGVMSYKITGDEIDYLLKVNFGAIAARLKTTRLTEIRTEDGIYIQNLSNPDGHNIGNIGIMQDRMLASCTNPKHYPYAYFPVRNELSAKRYNESDPYPESNFVNFWHHGLQSFYCVSNTEVPTRDFNFTTQSPFFKVTYILRKVIEYLDLRPEGDFFSDEESDTIYIYTQKTNQYIEDFASLDPSMTYMPNITIIEFLKQLRERLRLSIDINLLDGTATVRTAKTIFSDPEFLDLSQYISSITEASGTEKNGFKVILAPDQTDEMFLYETAENKSRAPLFRMIIGDGSNEVALQASTLKKTVEGSLTYPEARQRTTFYWKRYGHPELEDNAFPPSDANDPTTINNWPLRLLKYSGMKVVPGGIFPEAVPYDLDETDGNWYRFKNDAKNVTIKANVPVNVLQQLNKSQLIGAISNEGYFFKAIPTLNKYAITNQRQDLTEITIEAMTMVQDYETTQLIENVTQFSIADDTGQYCSIKAFFDKAEFSQLEIWADPITPGAAEFTGGTILEPTDKGGAGGGRVSIKRTSGSATEGIYLKVKRQPQYLYYNGTRILFTFSSGYWRATMPFKYGNSRRSYWIVF